MDHITFKVNGETHSVGSDVSSDMHLVDLLRTRLQLRGTKYMCREGGCGACIVSAATAPGEKPHAVNSCLVSITSCQGWEITTIEKVGNKLQGYHKIQETLAKENGTQCGYCSPGWVMSLYSLLQSDKKLTMLDIEKSFGSNLCRCTGYRPILKAFKKFASDSPEPLTTDIEDLKICEKTNKICEKTCSDEDWCVVSENSITEESVIKVNLSDGKKWYKIYSTSDIFDIFKEVGDDSYMLVAGNTAKGVVPIDEYPRVLIDITGVKELKEHDVDQNLVIGASTTLSEVLNIFENTGKTENFTYLEKMHDHLLSVAHIPVRNLGTIAGNLMTKHKYRKFPSDIFLLLETVGAFLTILESKFSKKKVSMQEFLDTDMKGKVLYNVLLPPLNDIKCKLVTFKVMPRSQSAHAMVNAGFLLKLENNKVLESRLVFGGLSAEFIRASQTEKYLQGKALFDNNTLQDALKTLEKEIIVKENAPEPSPEYRKQLALALLYKGLLTLCPEDQIGKRYRSGIKKIHDTRPVSQARQEFTTDPKLYPLNEPLPKIDGLIQCAGEAKFTDDLPSMKDEVFSALVLSTVAQGDIVSIDASEALKMPGVVAFFSAKDIPGKNSFIMFGVIVFVDDEEVFCTEKVKYYNQPIGMIVANSTAIAERATKLVKVTYKNVKPPVLDINVAKNDTTRTKLFFIIPNIGRGLSVKKEFKNNYTIRGQYHLPMETIMCVTVPSEHGIKVYSTTQWMDSVQYVVSKALKMDENRVDVYVNRLGGAFGLKISRSSLAAVACSLAAYKLNRPCRLIQSMPSTTRALGKRFPCSTDVEVGVDSKGFVQYLNYNIYEDNGWNVSELITMLGLDAHNNVYKRMWWNYKCYNTTTDTAKNSWCRSPGSVEHIAMSETIMEQISYELSLDPYEVRMTNLDIILHNDIKVLAEDLKKKAQYSERRAVVNTFNAENRWKKRGLRWAFMKYAPLSPAGYEVNMSVCHGDGSVIISHGGIEMGQGINTKAIQIAAHFLNVPVDKIKVKGSNTITGPNSIMSGSSVTSQSIGMGVEKCCKDLILRLAPIKILLLNPPWETLIKTAHSLKIDLQVRTFVNDLLSPIFFVYGVALAEVEVDILTGESEILRVDLLEDVGQSVSPQIDVGQIEGAFIMGLGYWTSEKLVYDQSTGELLSDRTWDYAVPQARDIPQDFRVYFRENSYSAPVVLGAKVTGEPATCLAIAVPFAMREAVSSARGESRKSMPPWFNIALNMCWMPGTLKSGLPCEYKSLRMQRLVQLRSNFTSVGSDVSSDMQLVDYLRTRLQLRGTKYMCREGGCGACIVSAATASGEKPHAVNSCLVSVTSCQGWEITTIEKVGNKLQGYHKIQETLAKENGTQCGYCSPGWVMSLYSLLQSDKKLTMLDIEKSFGSNLCRCTGYRPILKAFKKFASDSPEPLTTDIEDLNICEKTNNICEKTCSDEDWCVVSENSITQESVIKVNLSDGKKWYKIYSTSDIFDIFKEEGDDSYMLVAGNTAKGVVPIDEYPRVLIDITGVKELKEHDVDQNLVIGASTTLSEVLNIFENTGKTENFTYLEKMHDHLLSVAHIPVRNLGTIAGNLMTKHKYRKFPSDIFLLLETVGAFLTILESKFSKKKVSMQEFLDTDMKGKVLYDVLLPPLNDIKCKLVTFKIMPRSQSAHAMVNAGFLLKLENNKVLESRLVFGGLSAEFIRASQTEKYLQGKALFDNNTLQDALKTLEKEMIVKENAPEPSPEYRKQLALALLYKGLLTLCPEDQIGKRYRSGIKKIHDTRPVSQALQEFTTDPKLYPLNEPLPKIDGLIQCAGEAKYTDDLPSLKDEVFSALVLSTVAQGDIESIDASEALVGVDSKGLVQYLNYNLYEDNGCKVSELISMLGLDAHNNVYKRIWWNYKSYNTTTDNAKTTWCRAPGSVEHIAVSETVMEQISYELSLDPYEVRMTNLDIILHNDLKILAEDLKKKAQYSERRDAVNTFNAENRWKKRGLRWAFMKYAPLCPAGYEVNMSVCHGDGSVIISHGGIEMGQGVNTKAIQIAAHFLNIPVDKIKVKGSNTITGPNSIFSSSSITSQSIGMGVEKCCKDLILRLAPIKILLLNPPWETLIKKAHSLKIDLQVHSFVNDILSPIFFVYGVALAEVEVDILTGESEILRVDLLEDVGQSVSPQIDVGQIEGAFIMGLGYWTSEKLVYDQSTGELLSDRTWDYVVPQARDIPQDFRVYFREKSYSAPIVLGAKVTGEPATCLAIAVPFAMREAVSSARGESGKSMPPWFNIDGPSTTEQLFLAAGTTIEDFKYT